MVKYGRFGVSIDKHYAIHYGARPVTYVPLRADNWRGIYGLTMPPISKQSTKGSKTHIADQYSNAAPHSRRLSQIPDSPAAAANAISTVITKHFLAFLKPFDSELPEQHPDYFSTPKGMAAAREHEP